MNAFDMISEPLLFAQQLCEHLDKVHQGVKLAQSLADAVLAEDEERIATLHEQVSRTREDMDRIKLSLYAQVKDMHFHSASDSILNQYLASQDKVADASEEFADLLVLHRTAIPAELHADLQALVAQVVSVSRRTLSLTEGLSPEDQSVCPKAAAPSGLDGVRQVHDENNQVKRLEMELARHVHNLEGQLDPATLLFLDNCGATLREMAAHVEHAADCLYLMIRQA
jgi:uncharacterized protein Yka (UPF0111/DUF47 family)